MSIDKRLDVVADVLDQVVEQAMQQATNHLPDRERSALLWQLRISLGRVLANAPVTSGDPVDDMRNRAKLAAALRAVVPAGDN
jgi:hypothetical protein